MNDRKRPLSGLLDDLAGVVSDMYSENATALERLTREIQGMPALAPGALHADAPAAPRRPALSDLADLPEEARMAEPAKPALPPFDALWKTADETIDWTEVLASPVPTDGLTDPGKWAQYREHAACVLHGDVSAYLKVLKAANPMADLMPFVAAMDVHALNSDALSAVFTVRPDLMESEPQRYLSGMALRIARDLFAVLPVTRVSVSGRQAEQALLTVDFSRQELNKVRFAFIDPVDFVRQCGGSFAEVSP